MKAVDMTLHFKPYMQPTSTYSTVTFQSCTCEYTCRTLEGIEWPSVGHLKPYDLYGLL